MRYAVVLLLLALFVSCVSAEDLRDRTVALMQADGVDPATATEAQWVTYTEKAISESRKASIFNVLGNLGLGQIVQLWMLFAGGRAAATGIGRANLKVIGKPSTEWSETFRAAGSVLFGMRSPDVAHEMAKPSEAAA